MGLTSSLVLDSSVSCAHYYIKPSYMDHIVDLAMRVLWYKLEAWCMNRLAIYLRYTRMKLPYPYRLVSLDDIHILHQSPNYLVVSKPYDLIINANEPSRMSLHNSLALKCPDLTNDKYKFKFRVLHRIDYATSGLVVVPLTDLAMSSASKVIQKKMASKYYLALVRGHPSEDFLDIHYPIGDCLEDKWKDIKMCTLLNPSCAHPRKSQTKLIVISRGTYAGSPVTEVMCKLITGRRHQIRVHCHEIGHTILGDYTYSNRRDVFPYRMFLHSHRMVLPNAVEALDITCPNPFFRDVANPKLTQYLPEKVVQHSQDIFQMFECSQVRMWSNTHFTAYTLMAWTLMQCHATFVLLGDRRKCGEELFHSIVSVCPKLEQLENLQADRFPNICCKRNCHPAKLALNCDKWTQFVQLRPQMSVKRPPRQVKRPKVKPSPVPLQDLFAPQTQTFEMRKFFPVSRFNQLDYIPRPEPTAQRRKRHSHQFITPDICPGEEAPTSYLDTNGCRCSTLVLASICSWGLGLSVTILSSLLVMPRMLKLRPTLGENAMS
eukprot:maker-scaffold97_size377342-snap-gene-0.17 protein:Tk12111 transcript:maker-scaffold97_size377342-snap-gene-0.17-mRNA-1 annotation:"rna pseudouridylate synthase domain-containing protein 1"